MTSYANQSSGWNDFWGGVATLAILVFIIKFIAAFGALQERQKWEAKFGPAEVVFAKGDKLK